MRDTRKFGRLGFYRKGETGRILGAGDVGELFDQFGPEPLATSMQADESLWRARLHPLRSAAA